jgi:hypothetical protein
MGVVFNASLLVMSSKGLWGTFSFLCRVLLMTALALTKHEFDRCMTDHISTHTDSLTKTSQCIHIFINMCPHTRAYSHTNASHSIHVYVSRTSDSEQQSMNTCIWIVMCIFIWGWGVYMWFVRPYEAGVCTCEASSCLVYFGSSWLQVAAFFIPLTRHASLTFAQFRKIRKVQKIKRERERERVLWPQNLLIIKSGGCFVIHQLQTWDYNFL